MDRDALTFAQREALRYAASYDGSGYGPDFYVRTSTVRVLHRRGLVTLSTRRIRGRVFKWMRITAAGRAAINLKD